MPKLSAVVITFNEETDVGRTLDSLAFADEVLVVDSGSTDRTVEIARAKGARVVTHAFESYGAQKRWATAQASHDWVLSMDADEVVTPELRDSIRALLAGGEPPCPAYRLAARLVFMGRPFSYGANAGKRIVRLFDRRRAGFTDAVVHEEIVTDGPIGELPGLYLHYTIRDLTESIEKMNAYASSGARALHARGKRCSTAYVLLVAPFHFVRLWIWERNFLNGVPGLAWAFMNATGAAMKRLKLYELEDRH
jgi:glycosyltransferase involved in cell wall biosynthesis